MQPISDVISMYRIHEDHKSGTGGRKRQEELLKIYQEFNPRFAILYAHLMNDNIEKAKKYSNIKIVIKNKIGRTTSTAQKLIILYPTHYEGFANKEITTAMGML